MNKRRYCDLCLARIVKGILYRFTVHGKSYAVCAECRDAIADANIDILDE